MYRAVIFRDRIVDNWRAQAARPLALRKPRRPDRAMVK